MSYRFLGCVAAAAMLAAAAPASAQHFSDGYQFLEAVRKEDGTKVTDMLNEPGVRIVDTKDRSTGEAGLHIVAKKGSTVYLRFLLQRDANPNIQDNQGNTPMMVAVNHDYVEGVQILITYKANVNLRNSKGETPLIRAVQLRNIEMVRLLLDSGADPDQADVLAGMSARDYAKADGRMPPAIVKALADAPKVQRKGVAGPKL
ncbi:ankyrin repeat domain-containing protein [Sphingomonas sp.]|uniref:ankyrin repeat domain-containing protein n=1 Tax=Sphingomonas sp. TaxID=28214 RepID=UPI001B0FB2B0|nr:ankyrin repeat domain-containing protein [Sphingomonas sp.]MBO9714755.1 ankyrin repeat domain-containing protein [Sphingomonas sp.]